ncbi:uncharacterized protein LOC110870211 [Helianthus annuus]|uniref:uncharacterized protein LOC110870211 n=1 Tax=Helianthus annuus TaxID=4232 RepID=UPI001652BE0A|nr:uncharacterized protein LOC110870211 [Helianthus annuus]
MGKVKGRGVALNVLNVYAPQGVVVKQNLWREISSEVASASGLWIIMGDFNAMQFPEEWKSSTFKSSCARNFNAFIHDLGLLEPRTFRVYNFWLGKQGYEEAVKAAVESFNDTRKCLKNWKDEMLEKEGESTNMARKEVEQLEEDMETRDLLEEEEEWVLMESKIVIKEVELKNNADLKQRKRIKWALDGDENSKFFRGVTNSRKTKNSIHGLCIGGEWVTIPKKIKKEILGYFRNRFIESIPERPELECPNIKKISKDHKVMLIESFSKNEIKDAVCEYDGDKAPDLDGLNMKILKHFWHLFETDLYEVLTNFYNEGNISCGSGSSFITLILKINSRSQKLSPYKSCGDY